MTERLREQKVRCVGVRDPDQGDNPTQGLFSFPGDQSPEQLLLDPENMDRAGHDIDKLADAHSRASTQGHGYTGADAAKRIFRALYAELGMER
jgi:hypothetical protein